MRTASSMAFVRRAVPIALLPIAAATCIAHSGGTRGDVQKADGPELHLSVMIEPTFIDRIEGQVPVPVFSSTKVELGTPDGGMRELGAVALDDAGFGTAEIDAARWALGAGTYVLALSSDQVDGGRQELRAELSLSGTERRVEGFALLSGRDAHHAVDLTIFDRAPATIELLPNGIDPASGARSYELRNGGEAAVFFRRGEKSPNVTLEVWRDGTWSRLSPDATCIEFAGDEEHVLGAGTKTSIEPGAQECRLTALPPGRYKDLVEVLPEVPRPAWETHQLPVEVDRVIEVESEFTIERREPGKGLHLFPDVPVRDLRQVSLLKTENQLGALVIAPDGRVACACLGARIGREAYVAVPGTGDICVAAEPNPSVETCEPLRRVDPGPRGEPVGDFPPFPPSRDDAIRRR